MVLLIMVGSLFMTLPQLCIYCKMDVKVSILVEIMLSCLKRAIFKFFSNLFFP